MTELHNLPRAKYGRSALYVKLARMPVRPVFDGWRQPYPDSHPLADAECDAVDDWAIELFRYCRRRPGAGLRMYAMLLNTMTGLWVDLYKDGCPTSYKAILRFDSWVEWAARLAPP